MLPYRCTDPDWIAWNDCVRRGGLAERAPFLPTAARIAADRRLRVPPFIEGVVWNGNLGLQARLESAIGFGFHDFAGSVVMHATGGWLALGAVLLLGARRGRYSPDGRVATAYPP